MESISKIMRVLEGHYKDDRRTSLNRMRGHRDPFRVLIGCLVSINIKDEVCDEILGVLFSKVNGFQDVIDMNILELEKILWNARYRRIKAARLKEVSREVLERFDGRVPDTADELLSIKGIGPKTCNIVLSFAFDKAVIPIDSNTIRISERVGLTKSKDSREVERVLISGLEEDQIRNANALFMLHGRECCVPISPFCSGCPVAEGCERRGVERER
jgi:endonuclease-3